MNQRKSSHFNEELVDFQGLEMNYLCSSQRIFYSILHYKDESGMEIIDGHYVSSTKQDAYLLHTNLANGRHLQANIHFIINAKFYFM